MRTKKEIYFTIAYNLIISALLSYLLYLMLSLVEVFFIFFLLSFLLTSRPILLYFLNLQPPDSENPNKSLTKNLPPNFIPVIIVFLTIIALSFASSTKKELRSIKSTVRNIESTVEDIESTVEDIESEVDDLQWQMIFK